jgi:hypothetical protein
MLDESPAFDCALGCATPSYSPFRPDQWRNGETRLFDSLYALLAAPPYHIGTPFDSMIRRKWPGISTGGCKVVKHDVTLEIAADAVQLAMADDLVAEQYAWRGYQTDGEELAERGRHWGADGYFTLMGYRSTAHVGTLTVGIDSEAGLLLDEGNQEVLDALRRAGRRIAEFVRLAVRDDATGVVYQLFRRAYELARTLFPTTDILIEVNPRHVAFYEKVLGFTVASAERICPRVNAPAVLMRLDLVELDWERGNAANVQLNAA